MTETVMVRVSKAIIEKYRDNDPKLKGLTFTAIVEVMLREATEKEAPN